MQNNIPEVKNQQKTLKTLDLVITILLIIILCLIAFELLNPAYDWDIDHEIYFGQRLLHGEFIWTQEFHDKLPFVQLLFILPALFSSLTIWRIISLLSIIGASWALIRLLPNIIGINHIDNPFNQRIFHIGALIYVSWILLLPGSITVLNSFVTSIQLISILLILYIYVSPTISPKNRLIYILLAGLTGTIAISTRPYLITETSIIIIASILWQQANCKKFRIKTTLTEGFTWFLTFGAWGTTLNLLPYVINRKLQAFIDGLSTMATDLNPTNSLDAFFTYSYSFITLAFWLTFIFIIITITIKVRTLSQKAFFTFLIIVAGAIATLIMMMSQHYWPHYIILFVGSYSILAILLLSINLQEKISYTLYQICLTAFPVIVVFLLILSSCTFTILSWNTRAEITEKSNSEYKAISDYINSIGENRPDFLVLFDMKTHWKLNESRHGFPHAAHTHHIYKGWWKQVNPTSSFITARNKTEYCSTLQNKGPQVIFERNEGDFIKCLSSQNSQYQLNTILPNANISVFLRKNNCI